MIEEGVAAASAVWVAVVIMVAFGAIGSEVAKPFRADPSNGAALWVTLSFPVATISGYHSYDFFLGLLL